MRTLVAALLTAILLAAPGTGHGIVWIGVATAMERDDDQQLQDERLARANDFLDRLGEIGFRGAVLIARGNEIVLEQGYGWADPGETTPIGPDTIFAIGSNTKPFTAAAILKLRDEGALHLDDPVGRYLPGVPADKQAITIHQLLTHSAGFNHSGIFDSDFETVDRDEAVKRIVASDLLFPPGSESSYADSNMILLAAIVECASGKTYETYLREELLEPAGMMHSGFRGHDPVLSGMSQATGIIEGEPAGTPDDLPPTSWAIKGAGGMLASVADLYRWHQAADLGSILTLASARDYATGFVPIDPGAAEGYGWVIVEPVPGHRLRTSAGGTGEIGHVNVIDWWLDDDLVVITSSADAAYNAEDVTEAVERIIFGLPQEIPSPLAHIDEEILQSYAGTYQLPGSGALVVTATHDRLLISPEGRNGFATLFPASAPEDDDQRKVLAATTLEYLTSGKDATLERWQAEQEATLGSLQRMNVVGIAAPEGGEAWTYVLFEFSARSILTRWIVEENGVLAAAAIPSEPPGVMFLPSSPSTFSSFTISQPGNLSVQFGTEAGGSRTLLLRTRTGESVTAVRGNDGRSG